MFRLMSDDCIHGTSSKETNFKLDALFAYLGLLYQIFVPNVHLDPSGVKRSGRPSGPTVFIKTFHVSQDSCEEAAAIFRWVVRKLNK